MDTPVPIQGDGTATVRRYTTRPFPNFFRVVQFQSSAESEYNGLTLELNKRYSRNWQAKVAYTYSKVIDTKPDATAVVVSSTDDAKYAMDPLRPPGRPGPGDNDVRHRAVLSGVWNLDYARRPPESLHARARLGMDDRAASSPSRPGCPTPVRSTAT